MAQRAGDHSAPTCTPVGVHVGGQSYGSFSRRRRRRVIPEERIPKHIVEQNIDVPMTQVVKDTLETMENTLKEHISECTPEQFFDAFAEPVLHFQEENVEVIKLSPFSGTTFEDRFSPLKDDPLMQKLQAEVKETVSTRSETSQRHANSAHDTQICCGQRYKVRLGCLQ